MAVIGISCFFHDSAAALVSNEGKILAAVQEERFSRKKHDSDFPFHSLDYCLKVAKELDIKVSSYVYYEKPVRVFMRLLETYFTTAPRGFSSFLPAMQTWISEKIFTKDNLIKNISSIDSEFVADSLNFSDHHLSHAASAFYPSPFDSSAILCMDAVGEWSTTTTWHGTGNLIKPISEINFPHSLGMLYSAFTYYCGFRVNSGEYKLMGLAPYGRPKYVDKIHRHLIDVKDDGSFFLNMQYFKFHRGLRMISREFINLFGKPSRNPEDRISDFYMDIASSIQEVTEGIVLKLAKNLQKTTGEENVCLSGGVALNCVSNGKLLDKSGFKKIWVQPASGDSGSSVGCALAYIYKEKNVRRKTLNYDSMSSTYLGPGFEVEKIKKFLDKLSIPYTYKKKEDIFKSTANFLSQGSVVGWFQGRMEFGPRALGNRSILGDPRIKDMQKKMNIKIKNRESFRPFAPAILEEFKEEYFGLDNESPYMLFTRNLSKKYLVNPSLDRINLKGIEKVNEIRSELPAITHIDNSCRVQTVSKLRNPEFYALLKEFYEMTNCPVLINTSFNVRGEPIVCTPEDAFRCFVFTQIDILVLGSFIIEKRELPNDIKKLFPKPFLIED